VQAAPHRTAHAAARSVECLRCLTTPLKLRLSMPTALSRTCVTILSGCRADCGIVIQYHECEIVLTIL
jgi:hypothetical protein